MQRLTAVAAPNRRPAPRLRGLGGVLGVALTLAACADLPTAPVIPTVATPETVGQPSPARSSMQGTALYVSPVSSARRAADAWKDSRPAEAALLEKIAGQPLATWFGDWNPEPYSEVKRMTETVAATGALPVYVLYGIPLRDCGQYSAGGMSSARRYLTWISEVARAIGGKRAAVVLEPDAIAGLDCLSGAEQEERLSMIRDAVTTLSASGSVSVYLDAGNARWHAPEVIAERLKRAGIERAAGFALNVSNFVADEESVRYGEAISPRVGGKGFVIDSSRNGLGPTAAAEWCNPDGRALGRRPTTETGHPLLDAYLWIKTPGESDGQCNGGPGAGQWWSEYALGLARRAAW